MEDDDVQLVIDDAAQTASARKKKREQRKKNDGVAATRVLDGIWTSVALLLQKLASSSGDFGSDGQD